MDDVEAERQRLEAELGGLEAERARIGYSAGMPDAASIARRDAYLVELDGRIAEIRKKLPSPRSTLHSRPPLPPGWTRDRDEDAGHVVDYDPWARFYRDGQ